MSSETERQKPVPPVYRGGSRPGHGSGSPLLKDLRWAYKYVDEEMPRGSTPQRERFRTMLKEKPDEFLSLLQRMEREHKPAKKQEAKVTEAAQPVAVVEDDVGTEAALGVLGRWLREWAATDRPAGEAGAQAPLPVAGPPPS